MRWRRVGSPPCVYIHAPLPRRERRAAFLTLGSPSLECRRIWFSRTHHSGPLPNDASRFCRRPRGSRGRSVSRAYNVGTWSAPGQRGPRLAPPADSCYAPGIRRASLTRRGGVCRQARRDRMPWCHGRHLLRLPRRRSHLRPDLGSPRFLAPRKRPASTSPSAGRFVPRCDSATPVQFCSHLAP